MKIATTTADFGMYTRNIPEVLDIFEKTPFRNIDIGFSQALFDQNKGLLDDNWIEYVKDIKEIANKKNMKFVQSHAPMGKPIVKNENYDDFMFLTKRSVEIASALGIENIVVHSGYDYNLTKEECFIKNKMFYDEILALAEKTGINILTENFNKMDVEGLYWIDNVQDVRELIDYVDHPLFHACWDTGHGNMNKTTQYDALNILGNHTKAIHFQDNLETADHHLAPFSGNMDIDSVMQGLIAINYQGYFTFEADKMTLANRKKEVENARLSKAPLELKIKEENLLYEIGKYVLDAYGLYEE